MRILMVGDVIGKPGRRAVKSLVPSLRQEYNLDLVTGQIKVTVIRESRNVEYAR